MEEAGDEEYDREDYDYEENARAHSVAGTEPIRGRGRRRREEEEELRRWRRMRVVDDPAHGFKRGGRKSRQDRDFMQESSFSVDFRRAWFTISRSGCKK